LKWGGSNEPRMNEFKDEDGNFIDYYAVLKVSNQATQKEIRKSFRKLAKTQHPDKNLGDILNSEKDFKLILRAKDVLTNPRFRRRYDEVAARKPTLRRSVSSPTVVKEPTSYDQWIERANFLIEQTDRRNSDPTDSLRSSISMESGGKESVSWASMRINTDEKDLLGVKRKKNNFNFMNLFKDTKVFDKKRECNINDPIFGEQSPRTSMKQKESRKTSDLSSTKAWLKCVKYMVKLKEKISSFFEWFRKKLKPTSKTT